MNAYTVLDKKLGTYGVPFFAANDQVAQRSFAQVANDPNTTIFSHPEDFDLYMVGEFDMESGQLTPVDKPWWVCSALAATQQRRLERESYEATTENFKHEENLDRAKEEDE